MARIGNYKLNASIYKLFESITISDPSSETNARYTIVESITRKKMVEKMLSTLIGYFEVQEK